MVSALDEAVGNITDQLRESGMNDDTLIVFTSDVSLVHLNNNMISLFIHAGHWRINT